MSADEPAAGCDHLEEDLSALMSAEARGNDQSDQEEGRV